MTFYVMSKLVDQWVPSRLKPPLTVGWFETDPTVGRVKTAFLPSRKAVQVPAAIIHGIPLAKQNLCMTRYTQLIHIFKKKNDNNA